MSLLSSIGNKLGSIVTLVKTLNWRECAEEAAKVVAAKAIEEVREDLPDLADKYGADIEKRLAELLPDEFEPLVLPEIRPLFLRYAGELLDAAAKELSEAIEGINPADNAAAT